MLKNLLNKKLDIFIILGLFVISILSVMTESSTYDIYWMYNIIKQLANGNVIYKDINLVPFPLYFFIGAIFLKIKNSIYLFYIYEGFLYGLLHSLIYINLRKKYNKLYSLSVTSICFLTINYFEYSRLCLLLIILIATNFEFNKLKDTKYHIIQGILLSLIILSKQNIGIVIIGLYCLYLIITKENIKNIIKEAIGFIIFPIITFIYLVLNNAFFDFLDLTIFAINSFKEKNAIFFSENIVYIIIYSVIITYVLIKLIIKTLKEKDNRDLFYLTFLIGILSNVYPILDKNHLTPALIFSIFIEFLIFYPRRNFKYLNNKPLQILLISICFIYVIIPFIYVRVDKGFVKSNLKNLENSYIDINRENIYKDVNDYLNKNYDISNIKFACVDGVVLYLINDRYDKYYGLFLYGNLGKNTPTDIIKEDLNKGNLIMVSLGGQEILWQYPEDEIVSYLEENATLVDEFFDYRIYKN